MTTVNWQTGRSGALLRWYPAGLEGLGLCLPCLWLWSQACGPKAGMKVPASPWWWAWWAVGQQSLNLCYLQSGQTSPLSWSAPRQLNDSNKAWLLFTARNAHSECSINIFYLVFIMTFSKVSWQTKIKDAPPTHENTDETAELRSIYSVAKEANCYL